MLLLGILVSTLFRDADVYRFTWKFPCYNDATTVLQPLQHLRYATNGSWNQVRYIVFVRLFALGICGSLSSWSNYTTLPPLHGQDIDWVSEENITISLRRIVFREWMMVVVFIQDATYCKYNLERLLPVTVTISLHCAAASI